MGLRQYGVVIACKLKAVMNIRTVCRLIFLATLAAMLANAPRAIAGDLDDSADVPDSSTLADSSPPNQVLEIPQQCDQADVAVLCDRSSDDSTPSADDESVANNPDLGSVYDYANQNIVNDASAAGTMNLPVGIYSPTVLSPAPMIVSSEPTGPGAYQQWAGGPGAYQQWSSGPGIYQPMTPAPAYIQPMPLGYHPYGVGSSFGPRPFVGGGFRHR